MTPTPLASAFTPELRDKAETAVPDGIVVMAATCLRMFAEFEAQAITLFEAQQAALREGIRAGELQQAFDLRWAADQRAIASWQAAHPGNDLVWPDRADLVLWLIERTDRAEQSASALAARCERLRVALGDLAKQKLTTELDELARRDADFEYGWDTMISVARAALAEDAS